MKMKCSEGRKRACSPCMVRDAVMGISSYGSLFDIGQNDPPIQRFFR